MPLDARPPRLLPLLLFVPVLLLAAVSGLAKEPARPADAAFHAAATAPEKALDRVLRLSEKDADLLEFLLRTPRYKPKANKGYAGYFTNRLLADMAARERAAVRENCQGRYVDGELCGLDHNPLTCAQDEAEGAYLYKTESTSDGRAVIVYKWPGEKKAMATFDMVLEGEKWKVDGVRCLP